MSDLVKRIADGEEFDVVEGLRELAKELVAGRSVVALSEPPAARSEPTAKAEVKGKR